MLLLLAFPAMAFAQRLVTTSAPNAQTGTTYTYVTGDFGKLVTHSNASSIAATLPQANGTTFRAGWIVDVQVLGAGTLTITPTTSTINGAATLVLTTGQGAHIVSNGSNYLAQLGKGGAGSTSNMTVTTAAGAPSGACTAGQTWHLNTTPTPRELWFCDTSGTWQKILSTLNTGTFVETCLTGSVPATPAAGYVSFYCDSTAKLIQSIDDAGAKSTMMRAQDCGSEFVKQINANGTVTCAAGSAAAFVYTGVLSGIPATCTVGTIAFITNATAGQNIYECQSTNVWTQQLNSGGGGSPPYTLCASGCSTTIPASGSTILASAHGMGIYAGGRYYDSSNVRVPVSETRNSSGDLTLVYSGALGLIIIEVGSGGGSGTARASITTAGSGFNAPWGGTYISAVSIAANVVLYQQFVQPFGETVATIGIYLGGIAASKSIAYGIYDSSCNLISGATGRFTGAAGAGVQTITLTTPAALTDVGVYHLGIATEDAAATIGSTGGSTLIGAFNLGTDRRFFTGANAATGTAGTYALPSACGSKTVSTNPILFGVLLP